MPQVEVGPPTANTLKKYGLDVASWLKVWHSQGEVCGVCGTVPQSGRLTIDHFHAKGWKEMPPEERRKHVRGITCTTCNHFILTRYGTIRKFLGAAAYLARHSGRDAFARAIMEVWREQHED